MEEVTEESRPLGWGCGAEVAGEREAAVGGGGRVPPAQAKGARKRPMRGTRWGVGQKKWDKQIGSLKQTVVRIS